MIPMRLLWTASLIAAATCVALAPGAAAGTCDNIRFHPVIDQTGGVACGAADWALDGGTSPVQTVPDYAGCYVFDEPPASWVPDCS